MATSNQQSPLPQHFRSLLSGLRRRIRIYVWVEGISLALIWILVTFLVASLIDHFFLWFFAVDLSRWARGVLLLGIAGVLGLILYRWIFRRIFVRLADHSMAVLLERRYGDFRDSLVTAVEMAEHPEHAAEFNAAMLNHTHQEAQARLPGVSYGNVFRFLPLGRNLAVFLVLAAIVGLYAALGTSDFLLGASRLYLLGKDPLPRKAKIEVVEVEFFRPSLTPDEQPTLLTRKFVDGKVKVPKGSSIKLIVRSQVTEKNTTPYVCSVEYKIKGGDRGKVRQQAGNRLIDGHKHYTFNEKPFKRILSDIEFDVVGRDPPWFVDLSDSVETTGRYGLWPVSNRERGYTIELVDIPAVQKIDLVCKFPEYLEKINETIRWAPGTRLPQGTGFTVEVQANKPLVEVIVSDSKEKTKTYNATIDSADKRIFRFVVPNLERSLSLDIMLHDTDDIVPDRPFQMEIDMIQDASPTAEIVMKGIGSAVTPDVMIPFSGKVDDDNAVGRAWIEVRPNTADRYEHDLAIAAGGQVARVLDFRKIRTAGELDDLKTGATDAGKEDAEKQDDPIVETPEPTYALQVGEKLILATKVADNYNLGPDGPHVSTGDEYQLEVVTPDRLLVLLEMRESSLRQRLEQIIGELKGTRDGLLRVKTFRAETTDSDDPDDKPLTPQQAENRARSLRIRITEDAIRDSAKSAAEVLGVAENFLDIREQIINNRVPDADDREKRLEKEVAKPLKDIGGKMFDDLDAYLKTLEESLEDEAKRTPAATEAIAQADEILVELDKVLQKLIKFETYNELLDIVRALIKEQEGLTEETKELRKKQLLESLKP